MPLTDVLRLLNARSDTPYAGHRLANPFVATEHGVGVHFADLQLRSHFFPISNTASGSPHGHAAGLSVTGISSRRTLSPGAVFVLPHSDNEFIYLDRLVRTLHALNYLTQPTCGNLLLKVHQRHIMSVPTSHGLAFEELLLQCRLLPTQVTLEIDINGLEDVQRLRQAAANYKSRGYGIAIARFGHSCVDFGLLEALQPNIVKLAPALLASAYRKNGLIDRLHNQGAKVMIEGADTTATRSAAAENGVDLLQSALALDGLRGDV